MRQKYFESHKYSTSKNVKNFSDQTRIVVNNNNAPKTFYMMDIHRRKLFPQIISWTLIKKELKKLALAITLSRR